ncbi:MAG: hypothetical protein FJZ01_03830 [Candidatus Sericytochromatia bacterium]|nr:hypothetical protein [Candidatus Tanganyikabacteria bacterium]
MRLPAARTHPPGLLLHKYWARKPHNVMAALVEQYSRPGDTVVDPFCGSGVFLREAALRGRHALGLDSNPIACLLSEVTTAPPDPAAFLASLSGLVQRLEGALRGAYLAGDRTVRFAVHETLVSCPACGACTGPADGRRAGRAYACPCGRRLRFNLETLARTRVTAVALADGTLSRDPALLAGQEQAASRLLPATPGGFSLPFAENRRILAFAGFGTADLFTPRNFSALSHIAAAFHAIPEPSIRRAALLLLTASAAQCSRLIAHRNNLTTGGPAWTVPGFWVPPVHLETNPLWHLRARLARFGRGLRDLAAGGAGAGRARVIRADARVGLRDLAAQGIRASLVFLDPPYGDSVPYGEFSTLWNGFLKEAPDLDADLSVSDRLPADIAWSRYREGLGTVLAGVTRVLAPGGAVVVTFNNNDPRAWEALSAALDSAGLVCEAVAYRDPAVVSAKAQLAPDGSYVGDLYAAFR